MVLPGRVNRGRTTLGVGRVFTKLRYPRSCASGWVLVAQLSCLRVGRSREYREQPARLGIQGETWRASPAPRVGSWVLEFWGCAEVEGV